MVLDLLLFLVSQRDRVVADDVLRRALWPEVRVTDASLRRLLKEARRAIGDDGGRQEQIQTLRGRGVRFAAPVTADGWEPGFVGRADLLELVEQTLEAVTAARGAVTLLHGPAGIGKTRALAELEARAAARDFRVVRGTGRAGAEGDAFHLWLDAAEELGCAETLRPADAGGRVVEAERFARFRELARALTQAAADRPLLVALDDLQLSDADSLLLLRFVAPSLRSSRVWLAGALRSSGAVAGDWPREVAALAAESSTQVLALRGLSADEIGAVVANQLRAEVSGESAALLSTRTEGNPLFALEVARSLHGAGRGLHGKPPEELATSVQSEVGELVARRCASFSADTRRILRAASALGLEFDPKLVAESESDSQRAVSRALDEASAAGLVDAAPRGLRRFSHTLIAEAFYEELASEPLAAARQHLRVAEALERRGVTDEFLLARHFVAARPVAKAERALPHACAAAREARRRYAPADAVLWYQRAVDLGEEAGAPPREICELLLSLAEMILATEGVHRARVPAERAARLAFEMDDPRLLSRAALTYAHRGFSLETMASIVHWLRTAKDHPCGDASLESQVKSRLAAELIEVSERPEVESLLADAEAQARALGEPLTLARVLHDVNLSTFSARDTRVWLARAEETARLARRSGESELEMRAIAGRASAHLELGERAGVLAALADAREFVRHRPFAYPRALTRGMETMLALLEGRFGEAKASIDLYDAEVRGMGSLGLLAQSVGQRFWLAVEQSQPEPLLAALEAVRVRFPRVQVLASAVALGHALTGRTESALAALSSVVESLPAMRFDWNRLPALLLAAEVAYRVRAPMAAAALEPELRPYAALGAAAFNGAMYYGSVSQGLGWLAAARGRSREAGEHFQRALAVHSALESPPWCERSASAIREVGLRRTAGRR
jgi:tetratricopeptide (TPR) repeat protein